MQHVTIQKGSSQWMRFLPGALAAWADPQVASLKVSHCEKLQGALMIADLSGFTRLAAKLSRDSQGMGAERISRIVNACLGQIVNAVEQAGGSVLSFEGDSLIAGWRSGPSQEQLAEAAWRACHCSRQLQPLIAAQSTEGETLGLRSAVAAGRIDMVHLQLSAHDRRLVLDGPCLAAVSRCATLAESGQTLVCADTWPRIAIHATAVETDLGDRSLVAVAAPPALATNRKQLVHDQIIPQFGPYLPAIVLSRPEWAASGWLAELRTVSTLFVRFTGSAFLGNQAAMVEVFTALAAKVAHYSGELLKIAACEGGWQALVVFGTPGRAHRDNPQRATHCAIELTRDIGQAGTRVSSGVATGETFCGALGTGQRAEYTVLGAAVNCAARLSVLAAGRTLIDDVTHGECSGSVSSDGPWPMLVPGLRGPLVAYVALEKRAQDHIPPDDKLIGRSAELARLEALLEAPRSGGTLTLIEGDAGVGKSALLETFLGLCRARGVHFIAGAAGEVERETPYFALRGIILSLIGPAAAGSKAVRTRLEARLKDRPEQLDFVPLLNKVIDVGLESTPVCDQLSSSARADNLRRLVRALILDALKRNHGVLALEDVQWLDSQSENLVLDLARSGKPIILVATSRKDRRTLTASDIHIESIHIEPLDRAETAGLTISALSEDQVPVQLLDAIWARTGGNPFFVNELCRTIRQRQKSGAAGFFLESVVQTLPQSSRAAVLARTDLLTAPEQFVLKIASATSATFTVADLVAVDLLRVAGADVADCVASLVSAQLLRPDPQVADRFMFSHAITREVVYSSMMSEQQQIAHAALAQALESGSKPEEEQLWPLILSQWLRAGQMGKAFDYLDRVADLRLRQFDNAAAIAHSEKFFSLVQQGPMSATPERLAAAHFVHGEAALNLGQMEVARAAFEQGLKHLQLPLPAGRMALALQLLQQIAEHLIRSSHLRIRLARRFGRHRPPSRAAKSASLQWAARAHEDLTRIYYFQGDKFRLIHATLRATNIAETSGELSEVLVVNYASLGAICGVVPLRRRATRYLKLALELSDRLAKPSATAQVNLLVGLYKSSIGDWQSAEACFQTGLAIAEKLGDMRKWCEHAVSLETILNPGLVTPIYRGAGQWKELATRICREGQESGNLQILGCGLTAIVRGHRALGVPAAAEEQLSQLAGLMQTHPGALEPIHEFETAAFLALNASERRDWRAQSDWLGRLGKLGETLNTGMKTRTLLALTTAFTMAIQAANDAEPAQSVSQRRAIAAMCSLKLGQFAKAYPIGLPRALLFRGDNESSRGQQKQASILWQRAHAEAVRLGLLADAQAAMARLRGLADVRNQSGLMAAEQIRPPFLEHPSAWRDDVERSAAMLGAGGWGTARAKS